MIFYFVFLLALPISISAHGPEHDSPKEPPGILPGEKLYVIDRLLEKINDFFTLSEVARIKKSLAHSQERLHEFNVLYKRGNLSPTLKALDIYTSQIIKTALLTKKLKLNSESLIIKISTTIMQNQELLSEVIYSGTATKKLSNKIVESIEFSNEAFDISIIYASKTKQKELLKIKALYDKEVEKHLRPPTTIPPPPAPTSR